LLGTEEGNKLLADFDNNKLRKSTLETLKSAELYYSILSCILCGKDVEYKIPLFAIFVFLATFIYVNYL